MKGEIISIGTELLMGEITDTNSSFLASQQPPLGIQILWITQVGDDLEMLSGAIGRALDRSDIVLTTGGLGPTDDDLTREAIAHCLGEEMVVQEDALNHLKTYFLGRDMEMPQRNIKQATLISSAQFIPNKRGTAPGWWVEKNGKIIVAMPGPPGEMQPLWQEEVVPRLRQKVRGQIIVTRNIKTNGLSEGSVDETLSAFFGKENPYLGIYAKADGIHLRIIARAQNEEKAQELIQPMENGIVSLIRPNVWGYDDDTPEAVVGQLLTQKGLSLATMESCTGGLLSSTVTDVPGSSSYFRGGLVTYSIEAKTAAGVSASLIEDYGAVSQQVADAMAEAARLQMKADIGIGVTGVAGPAEVEGKPVGTVYFSIALDESVNSFPARLPPRRALIKSRTVATALIELIRLLKQL